MHKGMFVFANFVCRNVDKLLDRAILKLAPGNAGSHQVLHGEPPQVETRGEAEKNRKTRKWSGNENGKRRRSDPVRLDRAKEVGAVRAIVEASGERTAIDGTRWRTQIAGQV